MSAHFALVASSSEDLVNHEWVCADCFQSFTVSEKGSLANKPVKWCFQHIVCPDCKSNHFVFTASGDQDSMVLEHLMEQFKEEYQRSKGANQSNSVH